MTNTIQMLLATCPSQFTNRSSTAVILCSKRIVLYYQPEMLDFGHMTCCFKLSKLSH